MFCLIHFRSLCRHPF